MTKKTEGKTQSKQYTNETKVLKKIQDGNKAAKEAKKDAKPVAAKKDDTKPVAAKKDTKPDATKKDAKPFNAKKDVAKPFAAKKDAKPFAAKKDAKPFAGKKDDATKPFASKNDDGKPASKENKHYVSGVKRTFAEKDGEKKSRARGDGQPPILNRRQKQKVSDLIKKLRISYNKLLMKKKEMTGEEKHAIVQECIDDIGEKYEMLCYKHDGCRVLQALVKFGNRPQRILVVDKLKDHFTHLMQ